MYCKYCGKEIADDSRFCKYCGQSVEEIILSSSDTNSTETETSSEDTSEKVIESDVSVDTESHNNLKDKESLKVELVKSENKARKSLLANEIVANLKMIALALLLWGAYILGFTIYHANDRKPLDGSSYWGESCYDPSFTSDTRIFNWENHYYLLVCQERDYRKKIPKSNWPVMSYEPLTPADVALSIELSPDGALRNAEMKAKEKRIPSDVLDDLKKQAEQKAIDDKNSFNEEISDIRKYAFEEDLQKHMLWSAIIALCVTILGRYLIKSIKWVSENKTE